MIRKHARALLPVNPGYTHPCLVDRVDSRVRGNDDERHSVRAPSFREARPRGSGERESTGARCRNEERTSRRIHARSPLAALSEPECVHRGIHERPQLMASPMGTGTRAFWSLRPELSGASDALRGRICRSGAERQQGSLSTARRSGGRESDREVPRSDVGFVFSLAWKFPQRIVFRGFPLTKGMTGGDAQRARMPPKFLERQRAPIPWPWQAFAGMMGIGDRRARILAKLLPRRRGQAPWP